MGGGKIDADFSSRALMSFRHIASLITTARPAQRSPAAYPPKRLASARLTRFYRHARRRLAFCSNTSAALLLRRVADAAKIKCRPCRHYAAGPLMRARASPYFDGSAAFAGRYQGISALMMLLAA